MKKVLVYSHDTFGLGNIRRMLCICRHLLETMPDLSILLLTGSPLIHDFRLAPRLDYVKLPCVRRADRDHYCTKYLGTEFELTMRIRSGIIRMAVEAFDPDLVMVDKKPFGVKGELEPALACLKMRHARVPCILVLRDIIDSPQATMRAWDASGYREAIERFYDTVAVLGCPEVFDVPREYELPGSISEKVRFCGYVRREPGLRSAEEIRRELGALAGDPLALVTAGGGEDNNGLMDAYLACLNDLVAAVPKLRTLVVYGPEAPPAERQRLRGLAEGRPNVTLREFTDDLMSYMAAADVVVSMGGYNTVCEILSLGKRAVIVPRARPVEEQWIRAQRMEKLGLFRAIHPDLLTPARLAEAVAAELSSARDWTGACPWVDLNALPRMAELVESLLGSAALAERPAEVVSGLESAPNIPPVGALAAG